MDQAAASVTVFRSVIEVLDIMQSNLKDMWQTFGSLSTNPLFLPIGWVNFPFQQTTDEPK